MWPEYFSQFLRPVPYAIDRALYGLDVLGLPSSFTNAARDLNVRAANLPVIAADAVYNYSKNPKKGIVKALKKADTNPSKVARFVTVMPKTNTQNNYSKEELHQLDVLDKASGGAPGDITYRGYRATNPDGRYAANSEGGFFDPQNVVEWSLGQTGHMWDEEGNPILNDTFAYDIRDTSGVYGKKIINGQATPMMYLRGLLGVLGSLGYNDGSNSYSAIKTRIPVSEYRTKGNSK